MRDCWIDCYFGDVTLQAMVVIAVAILRQGSALYFHFVRRLERACDHLSHSPHRLGIAGDDRKGAEVVKDVFSCDGFTADP